MTRRTMARMRGGGHCGLLRARVKGLPFVILVICMTGDSDEVPLKAAIDFVLDDANTVCSY